MSTTELTTTERVDAFFGGVKATSLALHEVLRRKVTIGLLSEELASRIFADTGEYLSACIETLPEDKPANDSNHVS